MSYFTDHPHSLRFLYYINWKGAHRLFSLLQYSRSVIIVLKKIQTIIMFYTGLSFGAPATTAPSLGLGGFSFAPTTTQTSAGFSLLNNTTATTANSLFGKL